MIKLIEESGDLHTPFEDIQDEWLKETYAKPMTKNAEPNRNPILVCRNEYGEVMSPDWKDGKIYESKTHDGRHVLAICLFDARETGQIPDVKEVTLPDGATFVIDDELHDGERRNR